MQITKLKSEKEKSNHSGKKIRQKREKSSELRVVAREVRFECDLMLDIYKKEKQEASR